MQKKKKDQKLSYRCRPSRSHPEDEETAAAGGCKDEEEGGGGRHVGAEAKPFLLPGS